jgi:ferredoxin
MLRFARDTRTRGVISPSRFQAAVSTAACTGCGLCTDICPVKAISLDPDSTALIEKNDCIGCGLCATVCPTGAISLEEVRPADFIPA